MKPAELARLTVEKYIKEKQISVPPSSLIGIDVQKAGVFVSIKTKDDDLRGCIGTIFPTKPTVIEEIIHNALAAATEDPRFEEINRQELTGLKYSVDILFPPEPITTFEELDPKNYGIIVASKNGRQALLLPDLEGIDTIEAQIAICKSKAGIPMEEPIAIQRFKVERYPE
jgi:AmmeMemoRadiSam system protein A